MIIVRFFFVLLLFFKSKMQVAWIYAGNPKMMWIDIGKFKLNGVDA
jgi:hypothetical protein